MFHSLDEAEMAKLRAEEEEENERERSGSPGEGGESPPPPSSTGSDVTPINTVRRRCVHVCMSVCMCLCVHVVQGGIHVCVVRAPQILCPIYMTV